MISQAFTHFLQSYKGISRTIWLLSFVSLINRIGTMVVCFMTLYLTQHLHFSIRDAGYVTGFYGLGSVFGQYVGGYLTDRIGYYRVQWLTLLTSGVILFFAVYLESFFPLCTAMFLFSLTAEAFRPANQVAIRLHSDETTRTRAFSLMRVSVNLAIGLALVMGGLLVSLGWHWLFWVDGFTSFAAAIILHVYLKEQKQPLQKNTSHRSSTPSVSTSQKSPYKDKEYLGFIFLTLIGATVFMQLMWTVPVFFKEVYGWSEAQIGVMSAINTLTVMLVEMPMVFRIENKRPKMWFVRLGILLYGASYLLFLLPHSWAWVVAVLYMVVISFGEILVMPFSTSWATLRSGDTRQGEYMALYGMAYSLTSIASPMLGTQIIAAFGFTTLWIVIVAMSALAWLGFYLLKE
ncbi:MAG: MFS transporter [Saprospiraceae bacterium]|nr:MFS transporter [Saprospiraceae bacterium]